MSNAKDDASAADLLDWYDQRARTLPWRRAPGDPTPPDAYKVWLSEIMLQQTTVATVKGYFEKFTQRWPRVQALAAAPRDDVLSAWAGLGYYARARNLHACAQVVTERFGGVFPQTQEALLELPGVGPYTAAAIAAIAFDRPATVVDGNVERVMARLRRIETPLPDAKPEIRAAASELTPSRRPGDYAQAVMDLGATVCTPRRPACGVCPWVDACAGRAAGVAAELPTKKPKTKKPIRLGVAYLAVDAAGRILLSPRPDKGLLGGMLGLPGTDWSVDGPSAAEIASAAPARARWRDLGVEARHTFTHFHLRLSLRGARVACGAALPASARWLSREAAEESALPTLMRKAIALGHPLLASSG